MKSQIWIPWLIWACIFMGNIAVAQPGKPLALDSTLLYMEGDLDSVREILRSRGLVALPPDSLPMEFFPQHRYPSPDTDTSRHMLYISLGGNNWGSFLFYKRNLCQVRLCQILSASENDTLLKVGNKYGNRFLDFLLGRGEIPYDFYEDSKEHRIVFAPSKDFVDNGTVTVYTPTVDIRLSIRHDPLHPTTITVQRTNYTLVPRYMSRGTEVLYPKEE